MGRGPHGPAGPTPPSTGSIYTQRVFEMDRLAKLKELEEKLYDAMQTADSKSLASIARQYRETIREIDELEGGAVDDEIGDLLQQRQSDGKAGAVR